MGCRFAQTPEAPSGGHCGGHEEKCWAGYSCRTVFRPEGKVRWRKTYIFEAGAFSADGKTLLNVSGQHLNFFDVASGDRQKFVQLNNPAGPSVCICSAMTLAPDGRRLALGMQTGHVFFCDPLTGVELQRFHAADRPA